MTTSAGSCRTSRATARGTWPWTRPCSTRSPPTRRAAVVRTYDWSIPTLSLGYFQGIAEAEADPRWRSVPMVRRPTGGGALWHDREVTYAVVVPSDAPGRPAEPALYRAIHEAIADQLRALGRRGRVGGARPAPSAESGGSAVFMLYRPRRGRYRLRRRRSSSAAPSGGDRGRSSSTARSCWPARRTTPELPGLSDLAPVPSDPSTWAEVLRTILPRGPGPRPPGPTSVRPDERRTGRGPPPRGLRRSFLDPSPMTSDRASRRTRPGHSPTSIRSFPSGGAADYDGNGIPSPGPVRHRSWLRIDRPHSAGLDPFVIRGSAAVLAARCGPSINHG